MALKEFSRVIETSTSTGTGALTLGGAVAGYDPFSEAYANTETAFAVITMGTDWELALVTYASAGNSITRTQIYDSTNAGAAVNWGTGTKTIRVVKPGWSDLDAAGRASLVLLLIGANLSTDGTLAGNSDVLWPTQKAVKTYADALVGAVDAMIYKGVIDCSANPNYPAADRGWTYRVSVAGKIGGASGTNVEVGDILICLTDGTASGTQAAVGAQWNIVQANIDGAVVGPASVTDDLPAIFDGTTGKLIKQKTYAAFKALLALVKGDVGLGNVDNTSDATKFTSTALTGTPTAPTAAPGTNTTQIASTGFVEAVRVALLNGVSAAFDTLAEIATDLGLKVVKTANLSDLASPATARDNLSVHGADIASAGTINLETATGIVVDVTGSVTITAVTLSDGHERIVRFTGAPLLTNGASLVLPGGANIPAAAGDYAVFRGYAAGVVRCQSYVKASGKSVIAPIITELLATTANRLFGTDGSGNSGLVTLGAGLAQAAGVLGLGTRDAVFQQLGVSFALGTIADDTAVDINVGQYVGAICVLVPNLSSAPRTIFYIRSTTTPQCAAWGTGTSTGTFNYSTSALAGTTGADGACNIAADVNGHVFVENRTGGAFGGRLYVFPNA